jgi:hypothetical protein
MPNATTFPVLNQQNRRRSERKQMPRSVPWAFAETFRAQALENHGQTLERLSERGGLAPEEMYLAAHGFRLFRHGLDETTLEDVAIAWLYEELTK